MQGYHVGGIVAGVGLVLVALGCVLIPGFNEIVEDTVVESVRFENGTDGYDNLVNPGSPTYTYFYFFNLTNAAEYEMNGSTPIVEEIGPYVYRTTKPKIDVEYREDQTKIAYRSRPSYVYEPSLSNGDVYTDIIVNVNFIVLAAAKVLNITPAADFFLQATESNNDTVFEPFIVSDYLWGFTEDTLIDAYMFNEAENGLFYEVNNTVSDEMVVYTGIGDVDLVNEIDTWKGEPLVMDSGLFGSEGMWGSDYANMINGTDGTQYKPFLDKDDLIYTFSTDLCRSFEMLYDSEVDVKGINTLRFVIDPENFAINEANEPFCQPDVSNCLPEGLLNVEECYDGVPLVASLPHFYEADPALAGGIIGVNPSKELHETSIDVEPTTGIAIQGNKRLQINYWIKPLTWFPATRAEVFQNGTVFPIFWLNEQTVISDPDAEDYKSEILEPILLLEIIQYVIIGIGALLMLIGIVLFAYKKHSSSQKSWA